MRHVSQCSLFPSSVFSRLRSIANGDGKSPLPLCTATSPVIRSSVQSLLSSTLVRLYNSTHRLPCVGISFLCYLVQIKFPTPAHKICFGDYKLQLSIRNEKRVILEGFQFFDRIEVGADVLLTLKAKVSNELELNVVPP